jgi:prepilin-type N-terminal cleavage/methylation domain-containing protein
MKKLLNKKGFTLIELIVVIAIIAILAAILIPALLNYIQEANRTKDQSDCRSLFTEAALSVATTGAYTPTRTGVTLTTSNGTIATFVCVFPTGTYSLATNFAKPGATTTSP